MAKEKNIQKGPEKKVATKTLKEKRAAKQDKKNSKGRND